MDLFVVPTIGFDLLYAYVIVRLDLCVPKTSSECDAAMESPKLAG
jgi:hypothetical protein